MDKSAFQLFKNNRRTNQNAYLHDTPIISYGKIIKVIDIQTVVVETIVQTSLAKEVYTVTLLCPSSALLEASSYPKISDTVLLLFLQKYDPRMFVKDAVYNQHAAGYNRFSGVGMLMSTVKGFARTVISAFEEKGEPVLTINSDAKINGSFNKKICFTFCRLVANSEDEELINMVFGEGRPFMQQFLARVDREYGFWKDPENEWVELDAAVTEKYSQFAPITKDVQGSQDIIVGLGSDKDDKPVETNAPITETVHGKAPITRDIRSPQTIKIGIGNAESESEDEQREAPVDITLGEKADITLNSKSALTMKFEKAILIQSEDTYKLEITGAITISSEDKINIKAASDVEIKGTNVTVDASTLLKLKSGDAGPWMPNIMPMCPLGPTHGGAVAGIAKLVGG